MALEKVTFTLDDATVSRLQHAADQLSLPKSQVVREAILEFYERLGKLSERERANKLRAFDKFVPEIPARSAEEVDLELSEIRNARRAGGRHSAPSARK
jgi:predicted DNA-binding protein